MNLLRQLFVHGALATLAWLALAALDQWQSGNTGTPGDILAGTGGFLLGFALAHLAHEWSHYLGALLGGAPVQVKRIPSPLFFDIDLQSTAKSPFLAMSLGGPLGNLLFILFLTLATPLDHLVYQAALAAALGSLIYVLVLEAPVSRGVLAGKSPLQALTDHFGQGGPLFLRATAAGLGAAAGLLVLI